MPRPSAESRRLDYLRIGAELATGFTADDARSATVDALADVKVADVAARSGVTKGALYHLWPSQEEYRKDLLRRLLEHNRQGGVRHIREVLSDAGDAVSDPRVLLRRYATLVFEEMKDDPAFFARFSFFLYAAHPEVAEALAAGDDGVIEDFAPYVETYLELIGRHIREPYTVEMVLRCANALFHGLSMRYRTSPDLVERELGPNQVGPYALALEALLDRFSEPVAR